MFFYVFFLLVLDDVPINCFESLNPLLDINDDLHLHVLHIVNIPLINNSLQLFTEGWDSHPLRTAGNDSPNKLWLRGQLTYTPDGNDGSEDARATMDDLYGVDSDGPPVPGDDTNTVVVIPPQLLH